MNKKNIPVKERLIFALDVPTVADAKKLVEELGDEVVFYKLGLELFMAGGYYELIEWLRERNKKIFVDLKFFDVPETVSSAVRQLKGRGVSFATIHAGNNTTLTSAVREKNDLKILAVTVLTSLDEDDMKDLGFKVNIKDVVLSRAKRALELGCDGVISSGLEVPMLRESFGDQFVIISPGIRPVENKSTDDQKRTVDVEEAFKMGADYIVVGRPIKNSPDRKAAAQAIQKRIAVLFNEKC